MWTRFGKMASSQKKGKVILAYSGGLGEYSVSILYCLKLILVLQTPHVSSSGSLSKGMTSSLSWLMLDRRRLASQVVLSKLAELQ